MTDQTEASESVVPTKLKPRGDKDVLKFPRLAKLFPHGTDEQTGAHLVRSLGEELLSALTGDGFMSGAGRQPSRPENRIHVRSVEEYWFFWEILDVDKSEHEVELVVHGRSFRYDRLYELIKRENAKIEQAQTRKLTSALRKMLRLLPKEGVKRMSTKQFTYREQLVDRAEVETGASLKTVNRDGHEIRSYTVHDIF